MILRFCSGSVTPASASRNAVRRVDDLELDAGRGDVVRLDLLGLAGPQQPVVDEHAGQLVADGPMDQCRGHRRVDAAGQAADHLLVADLRSDRGDLLLDDVRRRPVGSMPAIVVQEVLEHLPGRARVCTTSGWNCTPASRRVDVLERGHRARRRDAR